ncbi:glycosyltransferase [Georgenia muralis]|uniref:Glycosyltransferase involved in cell wall biosynthesis n=1 Tax=Georgenia muralis TaxID=154117 RepID=A0A3N4ZR08_9MICO|nr:glycosyltransferase [Georgenia muralis]RPF27982.1 glycosyltransferase involved in cell wall biosynthesis [Georgenia muralis]
MRVLQVTGSSAGGVARHAREISSLLAAGARPLGTLPGPGEQEVRVLLAGPADVLAPLADDGTRGARAVRTREVEIADRPRAQDLAAVAALRRLAADADVVHAHGLRAGALTVLAMRALSPRPRLVVTVHNLPVGGPRVRAVAAALERLVARGADVVLGVSGDLVQRMRDRGARQVERALVPAPARVATGDVDAAELRSSLGLAEGERLVLTVARLAPQKGLDLLVDAAALLDGRPSDGGPPDGGRGRHAAGTHSWRWVVVGDGPLRARLTDRVRDAGLPVILAGRREDVPELLAAADVVVSTATWEGQPIAVQEALRAGAPVVATDVGGTREVTGDAAVLVPAGDAAALAAGVAEVLADPARARALRAAARDRAAALPGPAEVRAQLLRVYTS